MSPENKNNYPEKSLEKYPFVKVNPKEKAPFCVDGRKGMVDNKDYRPYPQMLGGSLMPVVLDWLINKPKESLGEVLPSVFEKLQKLGYPLGVHKDNHKHKEGQLGCGFADNLGPILQTFEKSFDKIKELIERVGKEVGLEFSNEVWQKIKNNLAEVNLDNLPTGSQLIEQAKESGAVEQVLEGDHQEIAAIVNLVPDTTLDVDNNQSQQAFNLDLWLISQIAKEFSWDQELAQALSLGLYLATEMVLVEKKGKEQLPILVKKGK